MKFDCVLCGENAKKAGGGGDALASTAIKNEVRVSLEYREKHYSIESISTFSIDRELPIEKVR